MQVASLLLSTRLPKSGGNGAYGTDTQLHLHIVAPFTNSSQFVPSCMGRNSTPTPLPPFWPEGIFQGEGGGVVYIFKPPAAGILYSPPSFIRPPPLEGYFQGLGGGYKMWPPKPQDQQAATRKNRNQNASDVNQCSEVP